MSTSAVQLKRVKKQVKRKSKQQSKQKKIASKRIHPLISNADIASMKRQLTIFSKLEYVYLENEIIHKEQIMAAVQSMRQFINRQGPPLLCAQMQQGKTGVALCVIHLFKMLFKKYGEIEIVYLNNISDNQLRDQNDDRLFNAGLSDDVISIHHSNLKNQTKNQNKNAAFRLIIVDECHQAMDMTTRNNLKPFDDYMKKLGISYGKPVTEWKSENQFVLSISATAYGHAAQILRQSIENKSFQPIKLEMNPHYYSMREMFVEKRLRSAHKLIEGYEVTPFLTNRLAEFYSSCKEKSRGKKDNNGYLVLRAIGNENIGKIIEFVTKNYGDKIGIMEFNCQKNNIDQIDTKLMKRPYKPFVIIIRGSLRAGKTLDTTKHIRMWIDSSNAKGDSCAQSIGRLAGYEMVKGENRRRKDTFPIYCNTREVGEILDFCLWLDESEEKYNNSVIPSGNRNTASHRGGSKQARKVIMVDAPIILPVGKKSNYTLNSPDQKFLKEKIVEAFLANYQEDFVCNQKNEKTGKVSVVKMTEAILEKKMEKLTVSRSSVANIHSYAELLFTGAITGIGSEIRGFRIFCLDGPNENNEADWDVIATSSKFKQYIHKFFFFVDLKGQTEIYSRKNENGGKVKDRSVFVR